MATGEVPKESINNLSELGRWLSVNGEAIYGTRKWKVSHEGPTTLSMQGTHDRKEKGFSIKFTSQDFWFTQKGDVIYVISLAYPKNGKLMIKSLLNTEIRSVELIGKDKVPFKMLDKGLQVDLPDAQMDNKGYVLKIMQ
jgi:alpha-L-fucosidase